MDGFSDAQLSARIKVVGVGGGGCNAVNRMIEAGITGVEFIVVNTDAQALAVSNAPIRVRIGNDGLGTGADASKGARAAEESRDEIRSVLEDADMVFVTAGLGGGTGTGASPVVASIARELGALTVAVVTRPFGFEGSRRAHVAEQGLQELKDQVDTLIAIKNDRLLQLVDSHAPLKKAFLVADEILRQGIQGISELITESGLINTDFNDVRAVMESGGAALMAIGRASGEERALAAAQQAITSPLLDITIHGATGVLFSIKGSSDLTLVEVSQAAELIRQAAAPDGNIIFGSVVDEEMDGEIQVTVIATGFDIDESGHLQLSTTETTSPSAVQDTNTFRRPFDNADLDVPAFLRRS